MGKIFAIFIMTTLFTICLDKKYRFDSNDTKTATIALQPLGPYESIYLEKLKVDLGLFFNCKIVVLKPKNVSNKFFIKEGIIDAERCLEYFDFSNPEGISILVVLTHYDLVKTSNSGILNKMKGVFGMGNVNGSVCVISDNRLSLNGNALFNYRLYKVILHEIGHNLGLPHCTNTEQECLMAENNGLIWILDEVDRDYCQNCRKKIFN